MAYQVGFNGSVKYQLMEDEADIDCRALCAKLKAKSFLVALVIAFLLKDRFSTL